MKTKHLVSTGVILALISSNIIIGNSYINSSKQYESKIKKQSEVIKKYEINTKIQNELIKSKEAKNEQLNNQINDLKINFSTATKEIEQLKKIYEERKEANKRRQINMELTFYVSDCRGCSGITKTGINVKNTVYYKGYRVIATDPRVIPLHSIVKIQTKNESYLAYAADTGGVIKGNVLDVLVSSEREAFKLGRQNAVVTIIREGESL